MLTCAGCSLTSSGSAWHWIAILRPVPGGAEAVCYCPVCAESKFRYFSQHRAERLAYGDELEDERRS
jgi:hypothetical protein